MSKRFGRQQKRNLKAQVASLTAKVDSVSRVIITAETIVNLARNICPNSICFEPQRTGDVWQLQRHTTPKFNVHMGGGSIDCNMDFSIIDLYQLEASLRDSDFGDMVHFEAELFDRSSSEYRSAYRISKIGFHAVPTDHVAHVLAKHLKQIK